MTAKSPLRDAITESHFEIAAANQAIMRDRLYMLAWLPKLRRLA